MSKIKKVVLIEPEPPGYHVFSRIALPRLGLPLLGAMLKQRGIEVSIYCQGFYGIDYSDVLSADLVGISTTTSTAPEGYRIARRVREAGIPVVMGGSHVSFLAEEALQHADYCVRGEGEYTFMELIDAIDSGSGFSGIRGLSYKVGDETRHNEPRELVQDLDSLPFPDLSLIRGRDRIKLTPILTSRGCPHGCNFCSVIRMFGRAYRQRSIDSVVEELEYLQPPSVFFYDDNFAADKNRTKQLLERMLSRGVTPPWTAQVRVDAAKDRELLDLMRRTNCYVVYIGFESVNPQTLKEFNKKQSVEDMAEAVRRFHDLGIMVHGMFVFGADSDDIESLRATAEFALKNQIDTVQFLMLTPLPGTPYFDELERQGRLLTKEWHLYDGQHVLYQPAKMSPYELQKETFKAMKRFYSIYECIKMLCGPEVIKFAAKVYWNLLRGRWRSVRWQMHTRMLRWFYRAYGHVLIRRFEAANKDFSDWIKAFKQRTSALGVKTQPSLGNRQ